MIEVLITIAIVVFGLWGLLEMQSRLQKSEVESYQRTQALILINDIASRINANRHNADDYLTDTDGSGTVYLGVGGDAGGCGSTSTLQENDSKEWCEALQGAAETQAGTGVGAMLGARGCIQPLGANEYLITVTWQGLTPISAPPANVTCATGLYNQPAGSDCVSDLCRRYVTTVVRIADLELP